MENRNESISLALHMRANYIETGDALLSKRDVAERLGSTSHHRAYQTDRDTWARMLAKSAKLSDEQQMLVLNLRKYAAEELQK